MLRSNIEDLLFWAKHTRGMTTGLKNFIYKESIKKHAIQRSNFTIIYRAYNFSQSWLYQCHRLGTVSGSNFSIPSFPKYEFDAFDESETKSGQRTEKRNSKDPWQVIDLGDRTKSVFAMADTKTDGKSRLTERNNAGKISRRYDFIPL